MAEDRAEMSDDAFWMLRAVTLSRRGSGAVSPNPLVGALVVRDGRAAGEGWHARFGGPHAERVALSRAGARARGATLYVTLEPCAHHGKTPPCAEALIEAGVRRVVAGALDPNPEVAGKGLAILRRAGIRAEIHRGATAGEVARLNAPYLRWRRSGLPFVTLKWAETADGFLGGLGRPRLRITGPEALREAHRLRAGSDAVLVGIGTALADDPLLTARLVPAGRQPVRIVLDSAGRLPVRSRLARSAREIPVWVVATDRAPEARLRRLAAAGCEAIVLPAEGRRVALKPLLGLLGRRQIQTLLVEGGREVHEAFLRARLADRILTWTAPFEAGHGVQVPRLPSSLARRLRGVRSFADGRDLRLEADLEAG